MYILLYVWVQVIKRKTERKGLMKLFLLQLNTPKYKLHNNMYENTSFRYRMCV